MPYKKVKWKKHMHRDIQLIVQLNRNYVKIIFHINKEWK